MDTVTLELIVIVVMIALNGFFAAAEFATISIRKSRIAQLVDEGDERAQIVEDLQEDPHRLLAVVQIGMTVTGATASALGGIIAVDHVRPILQHVSYPLIRNAAEPLAATSMVALISYLLLVGGELVPKAIGLQYADPIALHVAKTIRLCSTVGNVAVTFLTASSKLLMRLLGLRYGQDTFITREEVQHMVSEGHETGVFSETEHEYIRNVFEFTHTYVREVMVPRTRMVALELQMSREELVRIILEAQYSRYPVYHNDIEEIVGVLHDKDIMGALVKGEDLHLEQVMRPPVFVPEGKKVNELLKEMQRTRNHMALVVDEYGGISGLVTTEDLLEELVGEIEDEHDAGEPAKLVHQTDGSWLADGLASIFDLQEPLGIKLEEAPLYETVAGLVLNELGHLPVQGECLEWNGFTLICEQVTRTAVLQVRIIVPQPDSSLPQSGTDEA
jgi:putative hemolysin